MTACGSRPEELVAVRPGKPGSGGSVAPLVRVCVAALLALATASPARAGAVPESALTLVVYNAADPLSAELADFYGDRRSIPADRRLGLTTSIEESISREEYERTIAAPLRAAFDRNGWWPAGIPRTAGGSGVRFIALIRGIPLKIRPPEPPPPAASPGPTSSPAPTSPPPTAPMDREEASVDSELAALGPVARSPAGPRTNPYFRSWLRARDGGPGECFLVGRLDAPTGGAVRRMIEDALAVEAEGLRGWACIDARGLTGSNYVQGDEWLRAAAETARARGMPVIHDNREAIFAAHFPLPVPALYLGWYAGDLSGALLREDFAFRRGAVAVHIHSFSASTLRSPDRSWCGPLILRGAAATLGNVYEPYLDLTPHLDLFAERLFSGFTLAEAAWAATKPVSWMTTVIGDPLYRPFAAFEELTTAEPPHPEDRIWDAFRGASRGWKQEPGKATARLIERGKALRSPLLFEGLARLQISAEDFPAAGRSLDAALKLASSPRDRLRIIATQVELMRLAGRNQEALNAVRAALPAFPSGPDRAYLDALQTELAPPPPTPPPIAAPTPPAARPRGR